MRSLDGRVAVGGYSAATPVRRAGAPADIAGIIASLAGGDAALSTGQTIDADGGRRL